MIIENIEKKIKVALVVSIASIVAGVVVASMGMIYGYSLASKNADQIYVLSEGIPEVAHRSTREEMIGIEAKSAVRMFHSLFFNLPPDDKYINKTTEEAMYYIDESGVKQKNALMDKGFYNDILSHSATFSIVCDSVAFDQDAMTFTYYGRQRIQKKYSVTIRELIASGGLRAIPRTENNPFGYMITDYKTLSNRNLSESRSR